jgi:hypothetical protein
MQAPRPAGHVTPDPCDDRHGIGMSRRRYRQQTLKRYAYGLTGSGGCAEPGMTRSRARPWRTEDIRPQPLARNARQPFDGQDVVRRDRPPQAHRLRGDTARLPDRPHRAGNCDGLDEALVTLSAHGPLKAQLSDKRKPRLLGPAANLCITARQPAPSHLTTAPFLHYPQPESGTFIFYLLFYESRAFNGLTPAGNPFPPFRHHRVASAIPRPVTSRGLLMTLTEINWATPEGITDALARRLISAEQTIIGLKHERDMLARQLAKILGIRPSAAEVYSAISAKADEAGAIHRDDVIGILQAEGGLR